VADAVALGILNASVWPFLLKLPLVYIVAVVFQSRLLLTNYFKLWVICISVVKAGRYLAFRYTYHSDYRTVSHYSVLLVYVALIRAVWADDGDRPPLF
jgi:hypothetical protein